MKNRLRNKQRVTVKNKNRLMKIVAGGIAFALFGGIITFFYLNTGNSRLSLAADDDNPWLMTFRSEAKTFSIDASTAWLPTPINGPTGWGTGRVGVGSSNGQDNNGQNKKGGGGSFALKNSGITDFGEGLALEGKASYNSEFPSKASVYNYTPAKSFYMKFTVQWRNANDGEWYYFIGDGTTFGDDNPYQDTEIFTGFQTKFSANGALVVNYRNSNKTWTTLPGASSIGGFKQNTTYTFEIMGNNSTATIDYKKFEKTTGCTNQTIPTNTFDIYVNGYLLGNNLGKASLANNVTVDSWMFYGINSTDNAATLMLDDVVYYNAVPRTSLQPISQPTSAAVADTSATTVKINYSKASGSPDGYIAIRKAGSAPTATPEDFKDYQLNGAVGSDTVAYVGPNLSFTDVNVRPSTLYFYKIYSYIGEGECRNYRALSPLETSVQTFNSEDFAAFRSSVDGDWNTRVWEYEYLDGKYVTATKSPGNTNKLIRVKKKNKYIGGSLSASNIIIESGAELQINGDLTINRGIGETDLYNNGTLKVSGNFNILGKVAHTTNSRVEFIGDNQNIPAGSYNSMIVKGKGTKKLLGDVNVVDSLSLNYSNINTGDYAISLSTNSKIKESSTNYVIGNIKIKKTVNNSIESFNGLGLTIDAAANKNNLGEVTVIRTTGSGKVVGNSQSINRGWSIEPATQPTSEVNLTLKWQQADETITYDLTKMQVWKSTDKGKTWFSIGQVQNAVARTISVKTTSFSDWRVSDVNNTLPVKFRSFTGKENINGSTTLTWSTSEEINNEGFQVEKSADGKEFKNIGFINGVGNSEVLNTYNFDDMSSNASSYYRLKQIDFNGQYDYSTIIFVEKRGGGTESKTSFGIYPNPVKDHLTITSTRDDIEGKTLEVTVFSSKGKEMFKTSGSLSQINETLSSAVAGWTPDIYLIDIRSNGKLERLKMLKK